jgi:hypothetical protein
MATLVHRRNWAHRLAIAACVLAVHGGAAAAQRQTAVLEGTVQGLRPRSNTLTIDGIDNIDEFSGSSLTELSLEAVREF